MLSSCLAECSPRFSQTHNAQRFLLSHFYWFKATMLIALRRTKRSTGSESTVRAVTCFSLLCRHRTPRDRDKKRGLLRKKGSNDLGTGSLQRRYKGSVNVCWLRGASYQHAIGKLLADCKCRPLLLGENVFQSDPGYSNRELRGFLPFSDSKYASILKKPKNAC